MMKIRMIGRNCAKTAPAGAASVAAWAKAGVKNMGILSWGRAGQPGCCAVM